MCLHITATECGEIRVLLVIENTRDSENAIPEFSLNDPETLSVCLRLPG